MHLRDFFKKYVPETFLPKESTPLPKADAISDDFDAKFGKEFAEMAQSDTQQLFAMMSTALSIRSYAHAVMVQCGGDRLLTEEAVDEVLREIMERSNHKDISGDVGEADLAIALRISSAATFRIAHALLEGLNRKYNPAHQDSDDPIAI